MWHLCVLIYLQIELSATCRGGSKEEFGPGMQDPNNVNHWNGWPPPPGAVEAWKDWLAKDKKNKQEHGGYFDPENSTGKPYGDDIEGFPADWKGLLGKPFTGITPPPWAYVPKKTGKPSFCYQPAKPGNCKEKITRYGYNPYQDACLKFLYTGCNGNRNNFETELACERDCMKVPVSGCNIDSQIPIDYDLK